MKMTLADLKAMYHPVMTVPGDPNTLTTATSRNHIHKVNPAAKPSGQPSSHAWKRQYARAMAEARANVPTAVSGTANQSG